MRTIRLAFALAALLIAVTASRSALADITIQGTVGELGVFSPYGQGYEWVQFKFTDPNQTATCSQQGFAQSTTSAKYAWFATGAANQGVPQAPGFRELYAQLLVSKKGAPIVCTVRDGQNCFVTSCTLP